MRRAESTSRGLTLWPALLYLASFLVVVIIVSYYFLIPALEAAKSADPKAKSELAAVSRLVLALVLFVLLVGLILAFRPGRFFLPRRGSPRTRTEYPDAWTEAGKRLEMPEDEDDEDRDGPSQA
jgi:hypothetical protein